MSDKPRGWFRFSLRTFFILLTVFGVWLGVQLKWIRDRDAALKAVFTSPGYWPQQLKPAPWSIRILGARGYASLMVPVRFRPQEDIEDDLSRLRPLFPEATVTRSPFGGPEYTRRMVVKSLREAVVNLEFDVAAARASDSPFTLDMIETLRSKKAALEREEGLLKARAERLKQGGK